jgi:CRP/FNR family transcriptional regulator, cyclic AMP receptor protein
MTKSEVVAGLQGCELFSKLSEAEVKELATSLAEQCVTESYKSGHTVFNQGEYTNRLHVVVDGQVVLQRTFYLGERTATTPVAILGKGRAMGWTALLYGPRYSTASAVCQKPTKIISIEGDALRSLLEKEPDVGFRVMERLACMLGDRLRAVYNAAETHL